MNDLLIYLGTQDSSKKVMFKARGPWGESLRIAAYLDPLISDCHLEAVVETHATLLPWPAERGHTANVLPDSDARRKDIVKEVVDLKTRRRGSYRSRFSLSN